MRKKRAAEEEFNKLNFQPSLVTEKMNEKILSIGQRKNTIESYMLDADEDRPPPKRTRSVSKDYRRLKESRTNWRQEQLKLKEEKEMEKCTFKPDIQKTANKFKNAAPAYLTSNMSSHGQLPTGLSAAS